MKKYIATAFLIIFAASGAMASTAKTTENRTPEEKREIRRRNDLAWHQKAKYAFGVHTGLDIGGAVPFPLRSSIGPESKMRAVPKLSPALGVSVTSYPIKRFTLTAEVTYKQVGIEAEAWVSGQQFTLPEDHSTVLFRGTADITMKFSMLEIPVYVGYSFGDGRNRVFLGGYYSWIIKGDFDTVPLKGMVTNPNDPNEAPILVSPENPVDPSVMPRFNDYLSNWDAGMLVGYEWQVFPSINLSARVSMGFKDIFRKGDNYLDYKMLHMRGTVSVSYSFLRYTK